MRYLLDTHVLVWHATGDRRLPREHARLLHRCEREIEAVGIAAITLWELASLDAGGRLKRAVPIEDLFDWIEDNALLQVLPLTPDVALESQRLGPEFPRDPADQLIAATARVHGLRLLTADERIRGSGTVDVV